MHALSWSQTVHEAFGTSEPTALRLHTLRDATAIGLFIGLFFVLFQPFGTADTDTTYKLPLLFSIGIINGLLILFNEWLHKPLRQRILPPAFQKPWLNLSLDLLLIAFGNFLYIHALCGFAEASLISFIAFIGKTVLIGAFPVLFVLLFLRIRSLEQTTTPPLPQTSTICLTSSNGKEHICLAENDMRWITSDKNYVLIAYMQNGILKQHILRNTLTAIADQLANTTLHRCHRSYLVNTAHVQHITTHRDGLQLTLNDVPNIIPVSQRYVPIIQARYGSVQ